MITRHARAPGRKAAENYPTLPLCGVVEVRLLFAGRIFSSRRNASQSFSG